MLRSKVRRTATPRAVPYLPFACALTALMALVWLGACVRYEPRPLSPADSAAALRSRTLTSPELRAFIEANRGAPVRWPLPEWDAETVVLAAYHYHPDLAVARAEWAAIHAGSITAGHRSDPSLALAPQYNTTTPTALISPWILPIEFGVRIETAGKRGARLRRADELSRSAWWNIASAAWTVRQRVRVALLDLQEARAGAELADELWKVQDQWMRALERRYEEGEISGIDVAIVRTNTHSLKLARLEARREVQEAKTRLAAAIGVPLGALEGAKLVFAPLEEPIPEIPTEQARRQALTNRTDILASLAEYEASQEELRLAIAQQYPDIQLGPGYEYDQGDNKWTLGLGLSFPVFNRNRGPIAEAEARREAAAARFEQAQARVLADIELALNGLGPRMNEAAVANSLVDVALEAERRVRDSHEAGQLSRIDLLAAQTETLQARERQLRTRVAARRAYLDLEDALQSPAGWSANILSARAGERSDGRTEPNP